MKKFHEILGHLKWQIYIFVSLVRHVSLQTLVGFVLKTTSQFLQLVAIILPLKILLILASDSVQSYFKSFMTEQTRDGWVIGLSLGTIVLFGMSIAISLLSNRVIRKGSYKLLRLREAAVGLPNNKKKMARRYYIQFCQSYADFLVFLVASAGMMFLNPVIMGGLAGVIILQILTTCLILGSSSEVALVKWLKTGIRENINLYLQYTALVNFLIMFTLIVMEYLLLDKHNMLIAILTIFLGRRMLQSLQAYASKLVALGRNREKISELLDSCLDEEFRPANA